MPLNVCLPEGTPPRVAPHRGLGFVHAWGHLLSPRPSLTPKKGTGCFCEGPITKGAFLGFVPGHHVSESEWEAKCGASSEELARYATTAGRACYEPLHLVPGRYNADGTTITPHSREDLLSIPDLFPLLVNEVDDGEEQNVASLHAGGEVFLVACADIPAGQELLQNYGERDRSVLEYGVSAVLDHPAPLEFAVNWPDLMGPPLSWASRGALDNRWASFVRALAAVAIHGRDAPAASIERLWVAAPSFAFGLLQADII